MSLWDRLARYVENDESMYVNWDEEYFICPECEEPIYKSDWMDSDYCHSTRLEKHKFYCPICNEIIAIF